MATDEKMADKVWEYIDSHRFCKLEDIMTAFGLKRRAAERIIERLGHKRVHTSTTSEYVSDDDEDEDYRRVREWDVYWAVHPEGYKREYKDASHLGDGVRIFWCIDTYDTYHTGEYGQRAKVIVIRDDVHTVEFNSGLSSHWESSHQNAAKAEGFYLGWMKHYRETNPSAK